MSRLFKPLTPFPPPSADPTVKLEMKMQAVGMGITALIGIGLIRITPAVLQSMGMAAE
jgi:hypothetical protein